MTQYSTRNCSKFQESYSAVIRDRMNNGWEDIVHVQLRKVIEE